MENKSRIISVQNEGEQFFIYFDGTTHYDENKYGFKVEKENVVYLDEKLNTFLINADKNHLAEVINSLYDNGVPCFVGSHSPEVEDVDGNYIPNTNKNTIGLWRISTPEEKEKYTKILIKQNNERTKSRLVH